MRWLVLAVLASSGCDIVFQVDKITLAPSACGPFTSFTEVLITGVTEPRLFSIRETEQLALVVGTDESGITRPIPLRFDGSAWSPDPALQAGLDGTFKGATLAPAEPSPVFTQYIGPVAPVMLAWLGDPSQLSRYYWSGTSWTQDVNQLPLFDSDYAYQAGNVRVIAGTDQADRVRHTVVFKVAREQELTNQLVLYANSPPNFTLLPKDRTLPLNQGALTLGQGAITDDLHRIVYSARVEGRADLFAIEEDALRQFQVGGPISTVTTSDDEIEPWINEDCSKLYFRRVPEGQPNDPGVIYVAE